MATSLPGVSPPAALENPHAGQGAVLLDIGDDVGALIVSMPADTVGLEVEIRPLGSTAREELGHPHYPHVAVVARPVRDGVTHTLIYPNVQEGTYELFPLPDGPVTMTATVTGGAVTRASWRT